MDISTLIEKLNDKDVNVRLNGLREIMWLYETGKIDRPKLTKSVNNHIHTTYSFSPYSPTMAVYKAFAAGLTTAGIMDHDTIAGAKEFIEAGRIAGILTTVGFETRVKMTSSKYYDRRFNNPDQTSVAYVACHGVPHQNIDAVMEVFTDVRKKRNERNRKQVDVLNSIIESSGIKLDFEKDVIPISNYEIGGTITERHILYALSLKLIEQFGRGEKLVAFLKNSLNISISPKLEAKLLYLNDEYYEYVLLGALKGNLVEKFFIPADDECLTDKEFVSLVKKIGAISAYAYLGDVTDSVTGDKKAQKFEDDFLDDLIKELKNTGFNAITFMPTRNSPMQLAKLMNMCEENGLFQICGEDVNSPTQSFVCEALTKPEYKHLITATYALIGHENAATLNLKNNMFSKETVERFPVLKDRINYYYRLGKK